jgi:hypothetical protein
MTSVCDAAGQGASVLEPIQIDVPDDEVAELTMVVSRGAVMR